MVEEALNQLTVRVTEIEKRVTAIEKQFADFKKQFEAKEKSDFYFQVNFG